MFKIVRKDNYIRFTTDNFTVSSMLMSSKEPQMGYQCIIGSRSKDVPDSSIDEIDFGKTHAIAIKNAIKRMRDRKVFFNKNLR